MIHLEAKLHPAHARQWSARMCVASSRPRRTTGSASVLPDTVAGWHFRYSTIGPTSRSRHHFGECLLRAAANEPKINILIARRSIAALSTVIPICSPSRCVDVGNRSVPFEHRPRAIHFFVNRQPVRHHSLDCLNFGEAGRAITVITSVRLPELGLEASRPETVRRPNLTRTEMGSRESLSLWGSEGSTLRLRSAPARCPHSRISSALRVGHFASFRTPLLASVARIVAACARAFTFIQLRGAA